MNLHSYYCGGLMIVGSFLFFEANAFAQGQTTALGLDPDIAEMLETGQSSLLTVVGLLGNIRLDGAQNTFGI